MFEAAGVTSDAALDGSHAVDGGEAIRADIGVVALHAAAFEGQCVEGLFAGDAEIGAGGLPFRSVGLDAAAADAAFIGDEVGEFVFEGAPEFFGLAFPEFRVEFDRAIRPPGAAGGGLHPWVPGNADLAGEFGQSQASGGFRAPSGEAAVRPNRLGFRRGRGLQRAKPRGPFEFELWGAPAHCDER